MARKDSGAVYMCPPPINGGCAGVGRNIMRLDAFVIDAVLARAEAADYTRNRGAAWEGEADLSATIERRDSLTREWTAGNVSSEVYFATLPELEASIRQLRSERDKRAARRAADAALPVDVRSEWARRADDLSWRRSFVQRFLHSVDVLPMPSKGTRWRDECVVLHWRED
jgi:hypothetical protein